MTFATAFPYALDASRPPWLVAALLFMGVAGCGGAERREPFPSDQIELAYEMDSGKVFVASDGNAYREVVPGKSWEYLATVFDPEKIQQAYIRENGVTYRVAPDTQRRFPVIRELNESFEELSLGLTGLRELVAEERLLWGSFTLQSPTAQSVADYVRHRSALMAGTADFYECRVEPVDSKSHAGQRSLKCTAPKKPESMITCKASLSTPLVHFQNGDDFWFEGYFWFEGCQPMTLLDLECEFLAEHAGIRLRIFDDQSLGVELKALDKPQFRQSEDARVTLPTDRWVHIQVHYYLSTTQGKMEIWQDGQQVLNANGITLPFRSAIYNSLEVGISAHSNEQNPCVLYLDDLKVSSTPRLDSI